MIDQLELRSLYADVRARGEIAGADAKVHRGMATTALPDLDKVTGTAGLFVLTYNILRLITLSA